MKLSWVITGVVASIATLSKAECNSPISITVVVDVSGSVGKNNHEKKVLPAIKHFADAFAYSPNEANMGIISFGSDTRVEVSLDDPAATDKNKLLTAIDNIYYGGGFTVPRESFVEIRNRQLAIHNQRPGKVPYVVVFLTDGEDIKYEKQTIKIANQIKKNDYVSFYCIGINNYNKNFLKQICDVGKIYPVADFDQVAKATEEIGEQICNTQTDTPNESTADGDTNSYCDRPEDAGFGWYLWSILAFPFCKIIIPGVVWRTVSKEAQDGKTTYDLKLTTTQNPDSTDTVSAPSRVKTVNPTEPTRSDTSCGAIVVAHGETKTYFSTPGSSIFGGVVPISYNITSVFKATNRTWIREDNGQTITEDDAKVLLEKRRIAIEKSRQATIDPRFMHTRRPLADPNSLEQQKKVFGRQLSSTSGSNDDTIQTTVTTQGARHTIVNISTEHTPNTDDTQNETIDSMDPSKMCCCTKCIEKLLPSGQDIKSFFKDGFPVFIRVPYLDIKGRRLYITPHWTIALAYTTWLAINYVVQSKNKNSEQISEKTPPSIVSTSSVPITQPDAVPRDPFTPSFKRTPVSSTLNSDPTTAVAVPVPGIGKSKFEQLKNKFEVSKP